MNTEREKGASEISKEDQFDSLYVVVRLAMYDHKRFIKFLVVGGTGFILQYIVTYAAILLHLEQFIAAMIAGETAILSNFFLNNLWTFGDTKSVKEQGSFIKRLAKFNSASLGSIGIQGFVVYMSVRLLGEMVTIFGYAFHTALIVLFPTIIFLVIPLNYFVYNKIIWKTQYLKNQKLFMNPRFKKKKLTSLAFMKKRLPLILLVLILLLSAFLRLYKISDYMTFLGDEGRDVLVVKGILEGDLTFLGPRASA